MHSVSVLDYAIGMSVHVNESLLMGSYKGYSSESIGSNAQLKDKALKC